MHPFPLTLWQHSFDGSRAPRFVVGLPQETQETVEAPTKSSADPLESLRCDVLVALSNCLTEASILHPRLAPFLMDGLDNALERLPLFGHEQELRSIQQWICRELNEE